ncbi:MAG: hypothetical protein RL329_2487 [Bacteroidota bacterium]|jgi:hypothetical protein
MMTIQEFRKKLFSKEMLSEKDMCRLRGGDGEEDKRKDLLIIVPILPPPPPPLTGSGG